MLKIKANCMSAPVNAVVAAEEDLLGATEECCAIYQDMVSAGIECSEIVDVINDVMLVRDVVKQHGVRAYYYQFDKENKFAANFNVRPYEPGLGLSAMSDMDAEYVTAAEEGLKVWWTKFVEALKNLWAKFTTWISTTLTFRNHYINKLKKAIEKHDKLDVDKKLSIMDKKTAENVMNAVDEIHDVIKKVSEGIKPISSANNLGDAISAIFAPFEHVLFAAKLKDTLAKVGFSVDANADTGVVTIGSTADGLVNACPTESKTVREHGWEAFSAKSFAQRIVNLESKADFGTNAKKYRESIKKMIDDLEKKITSGEDKTSEDKKKTDTSLVGMLRSCNAAIRSSLKLQVIENKLVIRAYKTAVELMEANKKEEKK